MTDAPLESPPLERTAREPPRLRVLVVDDDKNIRTTLTICLGGFGCEVAAAPTAQGAMNLIEHRSFDAAFVDLKIGGDSGLNLIPRLLTENPNLFIVLMTAYATVETAVEAIRRGAWDYLQKPFTPKQIQHIVDRVVTERALSRRVADLEQRIDDAAAEPQISTDSPAMQAVLDTVSRAAAADVSVLFHGESGTGKGLLARLLHEQSRAARPTLCRHELSHPVRGPDCERALRARARVLHRRSARPDRPGRSRRGRHGVPRRDW